jgi:hypothetical protein
MELLCIDEPATERPEILPRDIENIDASGLKIFPFYFRPGLFCSTRPQPSEVQTISHPGEESFSNPSRNRGILQILVMARGNQRDKAREANQKKMAEQVSEPRGAPLR